MCTSSAQNLETWLQCANNDTYWGLTDTYGDNCDWYTANQSSCGSYDGNGFVASELCCSCDGGSYSFCEDTTATDLYGDSCSWYDSNPESCGNFDSASFTAATDCCACNGSFFNFQAATPEWEFDLDYAQGDAYIADLAAAYEEHNQSMQELYLNWALDRQRIDNYYWTYEAQPQFAEWEALDERTVRTIITWIVDGTQVKGKPLIEVFPGVEEYMLANVNPAGLNLADKFGLNGSPLVLAENEWMYADWWDFVGCIQDYAPACEYSEEQFTCVDNVAKFTCTGYDTWNNDFYTCYITEGDRCEGLWEWAVEYTNEAYWAGSEDYDYSLWLQEVTPTPSGPVTFSFNFDPNEVNTWLDEQDGTYSIFEGRYNDEFMAYFERVGPLYDQINQENESLQVRLESIDGLTEE